MNLRKPAYDGKLRDLANLLEDEDALIFHRVPKTGLSGVGSKPFLGNDLFKRRKALSNMKGDLHAQATLLAFPLSSFRGAGLSLSLSISY